MRSFLFDLSKTWYKYCSLCIVDGSKTFYNPLSVEERRGLVSIYGRNYEFIFALEAISLRLFLGQIRSRILGWLKVALNNDAELLVWHWRTFVHQQVPRHRIHARER